MVASVKRLRRAVMQTLTVGVMVFLASESHCAETVAPSSNPPQSPPHSESLPRKSTPVPFEADYKATYNGNSFDNLVTRKLERLPDGTYRHSYSADHLLYFLQEESVVQMKGCMIQPLHYSLERGTIFKKLRETIDFDWDSHVARYNDRGKSGEFKLVADAMDPMSVFLRIACQLSPDLTVVSYPETDRSHIEMQDYRLLGKETLDTPLGKMETVRIERVHKNNRKTYLWVMASNPILLVRAYQRDRDGSDYSIDLIRWKPLPAK